MHEVKDHYQIVPFTRVGAVRLGRTHRTENYAVPHGHPGKYRKQRVEAEYPVYAGAAPDGEPMVLAVAKAGGGFHAVTAPDVDRIGAAALAGHLAIRCDHFPYQDEWQDGAFVPGSGPALDVVFWSVAAAKAFDLAMLPALLRQRLPRPEGAILDAALSQPAGPWFLAAPTGWQIHDV